MNRCRPYLNRFVKRKEQQIEDVYHTLNLRQIRPITTRLMDHGDPIIINKGKQEMIRENKEIEIERENRLLLQKISSVMSKQGAYSTAKTQRKNNKSLNEIYRRKQMESIELENKRFLQRLQSKKPTMNLQKLAKEWQDNKGVIRRLANHEFNLTTLRSHSRVRQNSTIGSKLEKIKLTRVRIIDGQRMVVRIEFMDEMLKIVGDCQDQKDLKVIEIPREEAAVFLEKDCHGKVEILLDKLRYDQPSETMYLISENIEQVDVEFAEFNPEIEKSKAASSKKDTNKISEASFKEEVSRPSVTQSNRRRTSQKKHEAIPIINNAETSHTVEQKTHHNLLHSTSRDHQNAIPQPEVEAKIATAHNKSHPTEQKEEEKPLEEAVMEKEQKGEIERQVKREVEGDAEGEVKKAEQNQQEVEYYEEDALFEEDHVEANEEEPQYEEVIEKESDKVSKREKEIIVEPEQHSNYEQFEEQIEAKDHK